MFDFGITQSILEGETANFCQYVHQSSKKTLNYSAAPPQVMNIFNVKTELTHRYYCCHYGSKYWKGSEEKNNYNQRLQSVKKDCTYKLDVLVDESIGVALIVMPMKHSMLNHPICQRNSLPKPVTKYLNQLATDAEYSHWSPEQILAQIVTRFRSQNILTGGSNIINPSTRKDFQTSLVYPSVKQIKTVFDKYKKQRELQAKRY